MKEVGLTCPQEVVEEAQCHLNYVDEICPSFSIAEKGAIRENKTLVIMCTSSQMVCQACRENI